MLSRGIFCGDLCEILRRDEVLSTNEAVSRAGGDFYLVRGAPFLFSLKQAYVFAVTRKKSIWDTPIAPRVINLRSW